ncbi:MAG: hypothetical protein ACTSRA_00105 [Promethearchaeota archaeon]
MWYLNNAYHRVEEKRIIFKKRIVSATVISTSIMHPHLNDTNYDAMYSGSLDFYMEMVCLQRFSNDVVLPIEDDEN